MGCCGVSVQAQRQSAASHQGLKRVKYVTADPNEAGAHWRNDWDKVKVVFNGQRVSANTMARADSSGWIELYAFNVKTGQIAVEDGQPVVKRMNGVVEVFVPSTYEFNMVSRQEAAQSQWWPKT